MINIHFYDKIRAIKREGKIERKIEMNTYLEELIKWKDKELEDPEFKEAAVREEIVTPLLKALGYQYDGDFKIVRDRKLKHPFIMIGAKKYPIHIFPDYILEHQGKCLCVVEVKAPSKSLEKEEYISQAYSYALHREVAAKYYALCNGKNFEALNHLIGTEYILQNTGKDKKKFAKDLGIHLKMLSSTQQETEFYFYDLPIDGIALVDKNTYSIVANLELEGEKYCASFDFSYEELLQLKPYLQHEVFQVLSQSFQERTIMVDFKDIVKIGVKCKLGEKIYENENEQYMPLRVCHFFTS